MGRCRSAVIAMFAVSTFAIVTMAMSTMASAQPPAGGKSTATKVNSKANRLELRKGQKIALVGNSLAERMNLYGNFETVVHLHNADKELRFRNFEKPGILSVANRSGSCIASGQPSDLVKTTANGIFALRLLAKDPLGVRRLCTYEAIFMAKKSSSRPESRTPMESISRITARD